MRIVCASARARWTDLSAIAQTCGPSAPRRASRRCASATHLSIGGRGLSFSAPRSPAPEPASSGARWVVRVVPGNSATDAPAQAPADPRRCTAAQRRTVRRRSPMPSSATCSISVVLLSTVWPSTFTLTAYCPSRTPMRTGAWVSNRRFTHRCSVRSLGLVGVRQPVGSPAIRPPPYASPARSAPPPCPCRLVVQHARLHRNAAPRCRSAHSRRWFDPDVWVAASRQ